MKNSQLHQGDIAEMKAISYFTENSILVSKPITHSKYYDFIIDFNNKIYKVECKSTSFKTKYGVFQVSLRTRKGTKVIKRIDKNKIYFIFILDSDGNYYLYNSKELHKRSTVNLNEENRIINLHNSITKKK